MLLCSVTAARRPLCDSWYLMKNSLKIRTDIGILLKFVCPKFCTAINDATAMEFYEISKLTDKEWIRKDSDCRYHGAIYSYYFSAQVS